ncbi:hypothetical protein HS1genome_0971 [Sulfodiicoccus acidiphilus]|uniref:CDP-archaeol synthase n=1 Tax=Sulfodiicoccus acidiphilus TaxID=1670455 RepID=A0A348B330_9CREN|nr:CDP-2,3-bis-(O-geranylgeranyl)-sn-glycerol synthase [Sulfodiicoccus acidiphilus]BBD72582.1 hypothetical protein HS1genome_0971 [Sulfodiicoccus acidiphilus]GGT93524.1 hypothetical protein GCM10007116_09040 [Sulfodiicoccus acidiphilus]
MELYTLLYAFVIYSPALAANGGATFIREGTPLDFGRSLGDGRRILGDGKTFEGLLLSLSFGLTVSIGISRFLGEPWITKGFMGALGAMVGDLVGAFFKRRMGMTRGQRALGLDQLDFVVGATAFMLATGVPLSLSEFLFVAALAFVLHLGTNAVAYRLKIKRVPW